MDDGSFDLEDYVSIELSASAGDSDLKVPMQIEMQIPRAFSAGLEPEPAPAPPPAISKNGELDSNDLIRIGKWLAADPGSLSRAEEDSGTGMTYKREFIMYLQKRAGELPEGRGLAFLQQHRINGNIDSIRKARNKRDLYAAYTDWQSLSQLYERGPTGAIQLKRSKQDAIKEKWGRKKGEDDELDEIDDLLGPDTPSPRRDSKPSYGAGAAGKSSLSSGGGGELRRGSTVPSTGPSTGYGSSSSSLYGASASSGPSGPSASGGYGSSYGSSAAPTSSSPLRAGRRAAAGGSAFSYGAMAVADDDHGGYGDDFEIEDDDAPTPALGPRLDSGGYTASSLGRSTTAPSGAGSASSLSGIPSLAPKARPAVDVSGGSADFMDDIDAILDM